MPKDMAAGILAGSLSIVLAWALKTYTHVDIPVEVSGAIGVIFQAMVHQYFPENSVPGVTAVSIVTQETPKDKEPLHENLPSQ